MLRVVIDTNVFVSAFLTGGDCVRIMEMWKRGKFTLVTSREILEEISDVLKRPSIGAPQSYIFRLRRIIRQKAKVVKPYLRVRVSKDPGDDKFIECAIKGKAKVIVTGDPHLKEIGEYKGILIMGVKDFLENFEQLL